MRAIVTGANGGIGKAICSGLLAAGHSVIMVSRPSTGRTPFFEKMMEIYGEEKVSLLFVNLADTESIRCGARKLVDQGDPIDVVINNAGMMEKGLQIASNGFEMHAMVNCFGPALFTWGIRPLLRGGARIINTVSMTIWVGMIPDEYPKPMEKFNRFRRYSDSKLALQLLSFSLAKELYNDGITVNCVDPGIVDTSIISLNNWLDPLVNMLFRPLIRRPERGAATVLFLAIDKSVQGKTGGLYKDKRPKDVTRLELCSGATKVWEIFNSLVG
jgi:NAD(P)-dependent dehydrogenase (short-subunit alcohol dehydrogenase family)